MTTITRHPHAAKGPEASRRRPAVTPAAPKASGVAPELNEACGRYPSWADLLGER